MHYFRVIKVGALLLLIFVAGGLSGMILQRQLTRRAMRDGGTGPAYQSPAQMLSRMEGVLKLTPEQSLKVGALIEEFESERIAHPDWTRLDRWRSFLRYSIRIRVLLTPEQTVTFDQAIETLRPRLQQRAREGNSPGG